MTLLGEGSLTVRRGDTVSRFSIRGGFLQVVDNRVRVVTEHVQGESHAS
jgi:F0F1-type ATP synthase epsilon subunit